MPPIPTFGPMSKLINWALTDLMLTHPEIALMGEDVGRKGGVYGVTQKLIRRFGKAARSRCALTAW